MQPVQGSPYEAHVGVVLELVQPPPVPEVQVLVQPPLAPVPVDQELVQPPPVPVVQVVVQPPPAPVPVDHELVQPPPVPVQVLVLLDDVSDPPEPLPPAPRARSPSTSSKARPQPKFSVNKASPTISRRCRIHALSRILARSQGSHRSMSAP
jgi:hypothetical protein